MGAFDRLFENVVDFCCGLNGFRGNRKAAAIIYELIADPDICGGNYCIASLQRL